MAYSAMDPGLTGMPTTERFVSQWASEGRDGQAAFLATAVRYGPKSTVNVVVTYAEFAQS